MLFTKHISTGGENSLSPRVAVLIGILQFFPDQARPFVQSVFGLTPI
jgi:hypothetical protein